MNKRIIIIGAGFTGMASAAYLAREGFDVEVYEKYDMPGGRARQFSSEGFSFDLGPQFLFMPEILEGFFQEFNYPVTDHVHYTKIDPLFRIFQPDKEVYDIPGNEKLLDAFFVNYAEGDRNLKKQYLEKAECYYKNLIISAKSANENLSSESLLKKITSGSHFQFVKKLFKDYHLVNLLEMPLPLLGEVPVNNAGLSFALNYSLLERGLIYPQGGINSLVETMIGLLDQLEVPVHVSSQVESYDVIDDQVTGIITHGKNFHADYFIAATDYYHAEQLLPREYRNYGENDWGKTDQLYSSFIFYLGINKKLNKLAPNSIINNFDSKSRNRAGLPEQKGLDIPRISVFCPSKLNPDSAPEGMENLVIRILIPPGVEDLGRIREHYFEKTVQMLENAAGEEIHDHIIFKKTLTHSDFESEFGTRDGRTFGWMHSQYVQNKRLKKIRNTHLSNFFYAEHPVLAGTGISSSLLSGELVARELIQHHNSLHTD